MICVCYYAANSVNFFRILATFIPWPLNKPFVKLGQVIPNLRRVIIGYTPYFGLTQISIINYMEKIFKGIGMLKLFGSQALENWDLLSKLLESDDFRRSTEESGFNEIIKYIRIVEKAENHYAHGTEITENNRKNANALKQIIPGVSASATAYVLRSIFHNTINMLLEMTFFINICKTSGNFEEETSKVKAEIDILLKDKNKNLIKTKIDDFARRIQEIDPSNIVDVYCLTNTLVNGATFSFFIIIIFFILFFVFFFVNFS
jgi:hypothetical protein